jgi:hypothetical protein
VDKRLDFNTQDGQGNWFAEAVDVTPRGGGGLAKIAGQMHPQVSRFLRDLRPDPLYQYVLMTPMGSFEYWGANHNGDIFPEVSLSYDHTVRADSHRVVQELARKWLRSERDLPPGDFSKFGFKTFEEALRYRHHANKDPSIAYGDIPLSVWNSSMHRVEVIVRHDREKAKRVGADEIITDIDAGRPRMISMGCRVKFDVCTVCQNVSRTQTDYCQHLRSQMGQILGDGKVVGAVNFFPVFFDLSDVIVPAAKESGVLMKVAGIGRRTPPSHPTWRGENQLIKTASRPLLIKRAKDKQADITKEILPNSGYKPASRVAERDQDLPRHLLEGRDPQKLLSTLAMLGIILKPREFQHVAVGHRFPDRARSLWDEGRVFAPRPARRPSMIDPGSFCPHMAEQFSGCIRGRSAFQPHLGRRVMRITIIKEASSREPLTIDGVDPFLQKVASAYTSYRDSLLSLPPAVDLAVQQHFGYYERNFFGDLLDQAMTKTASLSGVAGQREFTTGYLCSAFRDTVCSEPWINSFGLPRHSPAANLFGF